MVLAIWGKSDPFFIPPGAGAFARDAKNTTVVLLDTGHFALEEEADAISDGIDQLMTSTFA
jgi:pimeloyl-ACP methyl ester carboxylesterase